MTHHHEISRNLPQVLYTAKQLDGANSLGTRIAIDVM